MQRILAEQPLHPERVRYYLEKCDLAFKARMRDVLLVYQAVASPNAAQHSREGPTVITVSVDEKPGLRRHCQHRARSATSPGKHPHVGRDHEYKRLGTCSILAALDLHEGHVTARVERRHRSREFIALLKDLDQYYPMGCTIRIILDNHSAHISKETHAYLGYPRRSVPIRVDAQTRLLAQHRRNPLWQDGAYLPPPYPGTTWEELRERTCWELPKQRPTCGSPLEDFHALTPVSQDTV